MLQVSHVSKSFNGAYALLNVSFGVDVGEIVAVLGPSGCGKSTLLGVIAGLIKQDAGHVSWQGQSLSNVPPYLRKFGMMFQDYALFPHRTVYGNVAFGLQMQGFSETEVRTRVANTLDLVGMTGFEHRDVNTLSGGEGQRVALARALAPRPRLVMLDEPLGALDRTLQEQLLVELKSVLRTRRQTAIYVTHDQDEAFAVADRVIIMGVGVIEQVGTPQQIYAHPASVFVARFLGMTNILQGRLESVDGRLGVRMFFGWHPLASTHATPPMSGRLTILLRPTGVHLLHSESRQDGLAYMPVVNSGEQSSIDGLPLELCMLCGTVRSISFRGAVYRLLLQVTGGKELSFEMPTHNGIPSVGSKVCVALDSDAILCLPEGED